MDKEVIDILISKKLRITIPRLKILRILKDSPSELTAIDIQKKLFNENNAKISSIYHVLRDLEKVGLIQRHKDGDVQASFSCKKNYNAIRFICSSCKTIFTLDKLQEEENHLFEFIEILSKKNQFKVNSFSLNIHTFCLACRNSQVL